ncbi:MAG: CaiB/BaiF CoA transferase family protein [Candidatus Binataceae bacterium]
MRYSALRDIRVLDLTHYIAGPYAAKLFADMGAEVIKVEPPWGEGARQAGARGAAADRGPLFAFLNTNKLGITLNLKHRRGRELLLGLLPEADLLFENFAPGTLARLGLDPEELLEKFPRLVTVSISNFGQDGPDRDSPLNDLVMFARGGWTYPVGEPDREPITPAGSFGQYIGGLYGAIGAMQALFARATSGRGQHVDISLLEAVVATTIYDPVTFQYTGTLRTRQGRQYAKGPFMIATLKCRDGYAGLHCVSDRQFDALFEFMGCAGLARDPRFNSGIARMRSNDELLELCERFFAAHDAAYLYREGQKRGIPICPIPTVAQVLEWEQLKARRYFETIDDPALGKIRIPGNPLKLSSHSPGPTRPAPGLGEHNGEVFGKRLKTDDGKLAQLRADGII